jgi:hypothetical protein
LSKPRKVKSASAEQVTLVPLDDAEFAKLQRVNLAQKATIDDLKAQIRELDEKLDRITRLDDEDIAIVMHKDVSAEYFHALPFDEKEKLKQMARAAMDAIGFKTGEVY